MTKSTPSVRKDGKSGHSKAPKIMPCNCKHDYQDFHYGAGMRVFNPHNGGNYACTVCGAIKES